MEPSPSEAPVETQDQPADVTEAPVSADETTSAEVEATTEEVFSENFDPTSLPDELQSAYKQMQGAFTKKTQDLAEQRKEAESAIAFIEALQSDDHRATALQQLAAEIGPEAVLEALGYEADSPEAEEVADEPVDPGEQALRKIEAMEAEKAAQAEQAKEAEYYAAIDTHIESQFEALKDLNLTDSEREIIQGHALSSLPADENGMPRIKEAADKLTAIWEAKQKAWVESKQAQRVSGSGTQGTEQFDIGNSEARIARMAAIMEANQE